MLVSAASPFLFSLVILTCSQRGFCSHGTGETQHEVVDVLSARYRVVFYVMYKI